MWPLRFVDPRCNPHWGTGQKSWASRQPDPYASITTMTSRRSAALPQDGPAKPAARLAQSCLHSAATGSVSPKRRPVSAVSLLFCSCVARGADIHSYSYEVWEAGRVVA